MKNKKTTLLMKERISFVWTACFDNKLFCLNHFLPKKKKKRERKEKKKENQIVKMNEFHNPTFKDNKFHRLTTIEYLRPVHHLLLHLLKQIFIHVLRSLFLLKRIFIHVLHSLFVALNSFVENKKLCLFILYIYHFYFEILIYKWIN